MDNEHFLHLYSVDHFKDGPPFWMIINCLNVSTVSLKIKYKDKIKKISQTNSYKKSNNKYVFLVLASQR